MHNTPLHVLIFSKDRACQVDSLLRSMRDHLKADVRVNVLYLATTPAFDIGYETVKRRAIVPAVAWKAQNNFRADVLAIMEAIPEWAPILLLVDDDVFFRPCDLAGLLSAFTSKHLYIDLCFFVDNGRNNNLPFIRKKPYFEWRWFYWIQGKKPRMYPFSLDGHIYNAGLLRRLLSDLDFKGPNSLESALHACKRTSAARGRNRALAPLLPVLFNNPLNRVQLEGETAHQNLSAEDFNARYCQGMEIDNGSLYKAHPLEAHFAAEVFMQKRDAGKDRTMPI